MKKGFGVVLAVSLTALSFLACAGSPATSGAMSKAGDTKPLSLTLIHVNDTHAKLESAYGELKVDIDQNLKGKRTFVELGGFPQLWAAVDQIRAEKPNNLFLHAGDVFQGTLYFTQFSGAADRDFLNAMKLDAMTLGNHEFDKGPSVLAAFIQGAQFPVVSCNIDFSGEPSLAKLVKPYVVKKIDGAMVGIIGVDTPDTPYISSPGPTVKFLDPAQSIGKAVSELQGKGVNKIILLSHLGYEVDKELAGKISDVDVIIGGHSHTLLGPMGSLGLKPLGDYPTIVKDASGGDVLIVTSWQWANELGVLDVNFDGAGKIVSFKGEPKLLAGLDKFRIYDLPGADGKMKRVEFKRGADGAYSVKENDGKAYAAEPPADIKAADLAALKQFLSDAEADPRFIFVDAKSEGVAKLATYSSSIDALKKKVATTAAEELKRSNNQGPGPIIADSMIWKTGADIAIMNPGGVRVNLIAGDVSVAQVYELQPFANTLVTTDLSGAEVLKVLDDMTDMCITSYNKAPDTAYVYVSGMRMTLLVNAAKGERVKDVQVRSKDGSWKPLDPAGTYKVVVNNFMAGGGDKNFTLGALPADRKYDTGFIDSEAMLDYVTGKTLKNSGEERVKNVM